MSIVLMNLTNLLIKEKHIAGIEISDSVVRIAFLRPKKKSLFTSHSKNEANTREDELIIIEEAIAPHIIERGVVVDSALLGKTLRNIWAKAKLATPYVIASIPNDQIYSRTFSFPKTVDGLKLTDAMKLAVGFQLPQQTDDIYLDWEKTGGTTSTNEILLSTIPRTVANGYIQALEMAGIKIIALESHLASLGRTIEAPENTTILYTQKTPDGLTIFALKNGVLRFSRTIPDVFAVEKNIQTEIEGIKHFLESQEGSPASIAVIDILEAPLKQEYKNRPELTQDPLATKWLIALGASIRGQIKEGEDNLISLLPVGTEEAYAYQKATTFIALMRNLSIGVSIFFVIAYLGAYIFTLSLAQRAERAIASLSITPTSPELLEKEAWIAHVNNMTSTGSAILATMPLWSKVLEEINNRMVEGVIALNLRAQKIDDPITIVGQARDRATINQLKKAFQESPLFSEVEIPLTNLEQRSDIPFTLSFRIKDSGTFYYPNN